MIVFPVHASGASHHQFYHKMKGLIKHWITHVNKFHSILL